MRTSDELFLLIKSMSKNEKGYFKRLASIHTSETKTNYVTLFNTIDALTEYNEKKVVEKIQDKILVKNLSKEKNHLYSLLLQSLRLYHYEKDITHQINAILSSIKILYNKGLIKQCEKLIRKGKKIIKDTQLINYEIELCRWEQEIAINSSATTKLLTIVKEKTETVNKLKNIEDYSSIYLQLYNAIVKSGDSLVNQNSVVKKLMKPNVLYNEKTALTISAKLYYYHIHVIYHNYEKKYDQAFIYSKKRIDLLAANPKVKEDNPREYINAINNHANLLIKLHKYKDAQEVANLITSNNKNEFITCREKSRHIIIRLTINQKIKNYNETIQMKDEIINLLSTYKHLVKKDEVALISYFLALACFYTADYHSSLKWCQNILNEKEKNIRTDIQCMARILNIIILYEIDKNSNLEHLYHAAVRYFKKTKHANIDALNFINQMILVNGTKKKHSISFFEQNKLFNAFARQEEAIVGLKNIEPWIEMYIKREK